VPTYVAEVYVPRSRARAARAAGRRARAAAERLRESGIPVRYVRTLHLPDDETCFHVVEAASPDDVLELARRAGLGAVRVSAAVEALAGARPAGCPPRRSPAR
jgi:hypothetical protein